MLEYLSLLLRSFLPGQPTKTHCSFLPQDSDSGSQGKRTEWLTDVRQWQKGAECPSNALEWIVLLIKEVHTFICSFGPRNGELVITWVHLYPGATYPSKQVEFVLFFAPNPGSFRQKKKATKDSGVAVHWNLNPVSTATLSGEERKSPSYHGRFKAGEKTKAIFQRPAGWKNKVPC